MRRKNRQADKGESGNFKNMLYLVGSILGIAVIAFIVTFILYGNKLNEQAKASKLSSEKLASLVPNQQDGSFNTIAEQASSNMGKTVEESKQEEQKENTIESNHITEPEVVKQEEKPQENQKEETAPKQEEKEQVNQEEKRQLQFQMPVEGEIIKTFSKDSLLFSETLQEWVTHTGLDIRAEKTTVVKAAEEGVVKSIKNDPRYGLTVIIEHDHGFTSIYSNLLTAEFVQEKETVKKGQTIGTVGNTATFEIADETHLHFEMTKEGEKVDPSIYMK